MYSMHKHKKLNMLYSMQIIHEFWRYRRKKDSCKQSKIMLQIKQLTFPLYTAQTTYKLTYLTKVKAVLIIHPQCASHSTCLLSHPYFNTLFNTINHCNQISTTSPYIQEIIMITSKLEGGADDNSFTKKFISYWKYWGI